MTDEELDDLEDAIDGEQWRRRIENAKQAVGDFGDSNTLVDFFRRRNRRKK